MDAIDDFLTQYGTKTAGPRLDALGKPFSTAMENMPGTFAGALAGGVALSMAAAIPVAASHIYNAATKARDFRAMLSYSPDLQEAHRANPKAVLMAYDTLRRMNPELSKDPLTSAAFVRELHADPRVALGLAETALKLAPKGPGAMQEAFMTGAQTGVQGAQQARSQEAQARAHMDQQKTLMGMKNKLEMAAEGRKNRAQSDRDMAQASGTREQFYEQQIARNLSSPGNFDSDNMFSTPVLRPEVGAANRKLLHFKRMRDMRP